MLHYVHLLLFKAFGIALGALLSLSLHLSLRRDELGTVISVSRHNFVFL